MLKGPKETVLYVAYSYLPFGGVFCETEIPPTIYLSLCVPGVRVFCALVRICVSFHRNENFWDFADVLEEIFIKIRKKLEIFKGALYEGCSKSKVPYFLSFFIGNAETNYQGNSVQEVCTTTL